jgi:hypothetical protein
MHLSPSGFPVEQQPYANKMAGSKPLGTLLAAMKVNVKKVHILYTEKCRIYVIITFFIPHSAKSMSEKKTKTQAIQQQDN